MACHSRDSLYQACGSMQTAQVMYIFGFFAWMTAGLFFVSTCRKAEGMQSVAFSLYLGDSKVTFHSRP